MKYYYSEGLNQTLGIVGGSGQAATCQLERTYFSISFAYGMMGNNKTVNVPAFLYIYKLCVQYLLQKQLCLCWKILKCQPCEYLRLLSFMKGKQAIRLFMLYHILGRFEENVFLRHSIKVKSIQWPILKYFKSVWEFPRH